MKLQFGTFILGAAIAVGAAAQTPAWPDKPVTMVVPFPPGGSTDMIARTLGAKLQETARPDLRRRQQAPAPPAPSAPAFVKRAAPDGYTLLVSSLGPFVIAPHLHQEPAVRRAEGLRPTSPSPCRRRTCWSCRPASPHKTRGRRARAAQKANPGKMTFASSGNGSSRPPDGRAVLAADRHHRRARAVQGRRARPSPTCSAARSTRRSRTSTPVLPHIKAGKLRALADHRRQALAAAAATCRRWPKPASKGVDVYSWQAVAAPKGLPADVKTKLHAAVVAALNDPAVKPQAARPRLRDRRQHARAVRRVPGRRVRALEEGHRDRQDHRRLTRDRRPWRPEP